MVEGLGFEVDAFPTDPAAFVMEPTEAFAVTLPATLDVVVFAAIPEAFEVEVSAGPASASVSEASEASDASAETEAALAPALEAALAATFVEDTFGATPEALELETLVADGATAEAALTPAFEVALAAGFPVALPLLALLALVDDPASAA